MIDALPFLAWPRDARPRLTILIFHRVLPAADPLRPGEIDATTFGRYAAMLARNFDVMALAEAADRLRRGVLPRRACCITFDDGYADNLTVAWPILAAHRLPATVFVATAFLDGGRMFNDSVIELVARTPRAEIDLAAIDLPTLPLRSADDKLRAIAAILETVKYYEPRRREQAIRALVDASACGPLPDDLMLSGAQLVELARQGAEIGGHTRTHAILNSLDDEAARDEIVRGRDDLTERLARPPRSFAYPNGRPGRDFSGRHARMLAELGFEAAVTTAYGVATPATDPFLLPRFTPWGRSAALLAARLVRNARAGQSSTPRSATEGASP